MGIHGSRYVATGQDPDAVPVRFSAASMDGALAEMQTGRSEVTVTFLSGKRSIPCDRSAENGENIEVMVSGKYTAHCVGVSCIAALGDKNFLVSDSFASCVPVIMFAAGGCWLAHSQALTGLRQINQAATPHADSDIYIISRPRVPRSAEIAQKILEGLEHPAEIIEIDTNRNIGVVVNAISKTILVYEM